MDVHGAHARDAHPLAFRSLRLSLGEHVANFAHGADRGSHQSGLEYTPARDSFSAAAPDLFFH
jgi:hypothetical protein